MSFSELFKRYVSKPESFWHETHWRNARKIEKFLEKGSELRSESKEGYVDNLLRLAYLRQGFRPKHIYLVNAGSSGSHWIEAMLGLIPGFYNGGEIYFPAEIRKKLSSMDGDDANLFLDAVYLLHSGGIYKDSLYSSLSNSAHLANHGQVSACSKKKVAVLVLRDPVDIVMSRTFRKEEYKNDIASGLDDQEYLEKNCSYLERFYKGLDIKSFDRVIKYEEFVRDPVGNLRCLTDLFELDVKEADVEKAVVKTSKLEEEKVVKKGDTPLTNIYLGVKKDHEWARDYIKERLREVIDEYENY
ncbi:hypothetical protein ACQKE4_08090 [Halomonas sp. NPDC076908]|uniref:hypothetical protein n=1 Tax=Halomonas sp. NPDC076908 TaxID=3390567 RepID=UPI003CFE67C7